MSAEKTNMKKISYKDVFCQTEYMKMIIAALINRFGDSVDAIATTWIVYEITGSAAWSAIIFGINKVPSILITPFAGAWVEGRNKKRIMVITDFIRALCVAIVATSYLLGFLNAGLLVLTTFIISTAEAFRGPANTALTPKVLEEKYYEYGISLMSTICAVVELIGTAAAAGIIALIGTAGAIYVDMITFLLSAFIIMLVNTKEQSLQKQKFDAKEYMATFSDGLKYVKRNTTIMFFCGVAIFLNAILVPIDSLQAPLARDILMGGAEILSVLGIALTLGMMLGTAFYPMLGKVLKAKAFLTMCCLGIGFYYIGFVVCKPFFTNKIFVYAYVALASFLCGVIISLFSTFINVEFVKKIDKAYLARAAGIMSSLSVASIPVASAIVGVLVIFVKIEWLFIVVGILAIVVCPFFLRSKVLEENPENVEVQEAQEQCAV